jgi:hypothetical protein
MCCWWDVACRKATVVNAVVCVGSSVGCLTTRKIPADCAMRHTHPSFPPPKPVFFTCRVNRHQNPAAGDIIPVYLTLTLCGTCFRQETKRYKTEEMDPNEFFAVLLMPLACVAVHYRYNFIIALEIKVCTQINCFSTYFVMRYHHRQLFLMKAVDHNV